MCVSALSAMLAYTHTLCIGGARGPIYLHAVEEEQRIGRRAERKREGGKKRKQQGILEKTQRKEEVSQLFPRTHTTNLPFRSPGGCVCLCVGVCVFANILCDFHLHLHPTVSFLIKSSLKSN